MALVKSIERAFDILSVVAARPAGISELGRAVGLPTSTVARLLKTLEGLDVVVRGQDGVYSLGPVAMNLASRADVPAKVRSIDHARLRALSDELGEIVGLSVRAGNDVLYVDQTESPNEVQLRDWSGERVPLHVVSSGLVFLAYADPVDLDRYLSRPLERFTDETECDPDRLRQRLATARVDGYVWTADEFRVGITSIAAPLLGGDGELLGALHCHGPSYRFPSPDTDAGVAANVVGLAGRLSHSLGWSASSPHARPETA